MSFARQLSLFGAIAITAASCHLITIGDRKLADEAAGGAVAAGGAGGVGGQGGQGGSVVVPTDRADVLFVVDNSRGTGFKQRLLAQTIPYFLGQLEQQGLRDVHFGVITTSLGTAGADNCLSMPIENDRAHLIDRREGGGTVSTYDNLSFLAWDPEGRKTPPGDSMVTDVVPNLRDIIEGAAVTGCGFEQPLEAWYRFLIDPAPYASVEVMNLEAQPTGLDQAVLNQREAFLRPDSLLAIVMLTDEDDCSIKVGGSNFLMASTFDPTAMGTTILRLPRPRAKCAMDPNDPCCKSCQEEPGNCPTDTTCGGSLNAIEDNINLRCWDQKRRFGVDFLYPIERYVDALNEPQLADPDGALFDNPIFTDLDLTDDITAVRSPGLVRMAAIVGVPWQDIARDSATPSPALEQGFQNAQELVSRGTWDMILGDPSCYHTDPANCLPSDPLMRQSDQPRSGTHPITGDTVSQSSQNPISGNERAIANRDDLQYACVFDLENIINCSTTNDPDVVCPCDASSDNPICHDGAGFTDVRRRDYAYPAPRILQVLKGIGSQGVLGSICADNIDVPGSSTYAFRPSFDALVESMAPAIDGN